jgi:hypothetical protein
MGMLADRNPIYQLDYMAQGHGNCLHNVAKNYCDPAMSKSRLQKEFFDQMADPQAFRCIFEHLPEVYFLLKTGPAAS